MRARGGGVTCLPLGLPLTAVIPGGSPAAAGFTVLLPVDSLRSTQTPQVREKGPTRWPPRMPGLMEHPRPPPHLSDSVMSSSLWEHPSAP